MDPHYACPECLAPLTVLDRRTLPSTGGPVAFVKVLCAAGHRFACPPDLLAPAAAGEPQPRVAS